MPPLLRKNLDIYRVSHEGLERIELATADPQHPLCLYSWEYQLATALDGNRTITQIQALALATLSWRVDTDELQNFVKKLSHLGFCSLPAGEAAVGSWDILSQEQCTRLPECEILQVIDRLVESTQEINQQQADQDPSLALAINSALVLPEQQQQQIRKLVRQALTALEHNHLEAARDCVLAARNLVGFQSEHDLSLEALWQAFNANVEAEADPNHSPALPDSATILALARTIYPEENPSLSTSSTTAAKITVEDDLELTAKQWPRWLIWAIVAILGIAVVTGWHWHTKHPKQTHKANIKQKWR